MTCQHCDKNFKCDPAVGCALPIYCTCDCHNINITGAQDLTYYGIETDVNIIHVVI